jgi:GT2 family glycosyltransferase
MSKKVGIILVNYKDYARRFLKDCRDSLRSLEYPKEALSFYIVDNETSPESQVYLRDNFSEAEVIANANNDGFAKGNNDGMRAALAGGCEYVWLLNMDTIVEPEALKEMIKAAETDEKIGAVQARLMLWPDKDKINSLGNITHFLGFGYSSGYREKWENQAVGIKEIMYPSGAAVLFKKEALLEAGFFDEAYWMYNEDQELGWRLWLAGRSCVLAPTAVVYHKYEFSRSISKYYWMDRNRLLAIFECYEPLTLILILPALLLMELGLMLFSIQSGWFKEKLKVWNYFLSYDSWEYLKKARQRNQKLRKVKDKQIVRLIAGEIWYQEIGNWKLRLMNPVFSAYWRLVRIVLNIF